LHVDSQTNALLAVGEAFRRPDHHALGLAGDVVRVFLPQPQRAGIVGKDILELVQQGGGELLGAQAGGNRGRHMGQCLKLVRALAGRLVQAGVFEGNGGLLGQRGNHGQVAITKGAGSLGIVEDQHAQGSGPHLGDLRIEGGTAPAHTGLNGHHQAGNGQAPARGIAVVQQVGCTQIVMASEFNLFDIGRLLLFEDLSRKPFTRLVGHAEQLFCPGIAIGGLGHQDALSLIPQGDHGHLCPGDGVHGAFQQGAEDAARIQAAQLAAEIEQQVHFIQPTGGIILQAQVLQGNCHLAHHQLEKLLILSGKGGCVILADGQQGGPGFGSTPAVLAAWD